MDNINDRALGSAFDIFIFLLAIMSMSLFFTASYEMLEARNATAQERNALKEGKITGNVEAEDMKASVYLYHGEAFTGAHGVRVEKADSGDSVTGASVFTEIQNLPYGVTDIYKNGMLILVNYPDRANEPIIGTERNVPYYLQNGKTDELLKYLTDQAHIDQVHSYERKYKFAPAGTLNEDRVVGIDYVG